MSVPAPRAPGSPVTVEPGLAVAPTATGMQSLAPGVVPITHVTGRHGAPRALSDSNARNQRDPFQPATPKKES